jgi:hypothetical protein
VYAGGRRYQDVRQAQQTVAQQREHGRKAQDENVERRIIEDALQSIMVSATSLIEGGGFDLDHRERRPVRELIKELKEQNISQEALLSRYAEISARLNFPALDKETLAYIIEGENLPWGSRRVGLIQFDQQNSAG